MLIFSLHLHHLFFNFWVLQVKKREESKVAAATAAACEAKAAEARKWEECVDEGEAFVTAMLASVVRSLAEGPKTETELDQVGRCFVPTFCKAFAARTLNVECGRCVYLCVSDSGLSIITEYVNVYTVFTFVNAVFEARFSSPKAVPFVLRHRVQRCRCDVSCCLLRHMSIFFFAGYVYTCARSSTKVLSGFWEWHQTS